MGKRWLFWLYPHIDHCSGNIDGICYDVIIALTL
jgi:hypothetical protein